MDQLSLLVANLLQFLMEKIKSDSAPLQISSLYCLGGLCSAASEIALASIQTVLSTTFDSLVSLYSLKSSSGANEISNDDVLSAYVSCLSMILVSMHMIDQERSQIMFDILKNAIEQRFSKSRFVSAFYFFRLIEYTESKHVSIESFYAQFNKWMDSLDSNDYYVHLGFALGLSTILDCQEPSFTNAITVYSSVLEKSDRLNAQVEAARFVLFVGKSKGLFITTDLKLKMVGSSECPVRFF